MKILIMCQGKQTRLPDLGYPKQAIRVLGESLIQRTIHFLQGRGEIHVIGWPDLKEYLPPGYDVETLLLPGNCILQGLYAAKTLWGVATSTLIVLGDVFFTPEAIHQILSDKRPFFFAGTSDLSTTQGELFAFRFDSVDRIEPTLKKVPCLRSTASEYQCGHLRNLLWEFQGHKNFPEARYFLPIDDGTTDFDKPEDLKRIPELEKRFG